MAFELTSPSFAAGAEIPKKFTCDGEDASPALEWTDASDDTAALVLVVDDPDARDFVPGSCSTWSAHRPVPGRGRLVLA